MTSMNIPDFTIIGSGFAGAVLACKLAEKASVRVIERNVPGEKYCCGGGIAIPSLERLGIDVPYCPIDKAIFDINDKQHSMKMNYAVTNRGILDATVAEKAKNLGAEYIQAEYRSCNLEKKTIMIRKKNLEEQELPFKQLIYASGVFADHAQFGIGYDCKKQNHAQAIMQIIKKPPEMENTLFASIHREILKTGYFWIFPIGDGTMDIGVGRVVEAKKDETLMKILEKFKEKYDLMDAEILMTKSARLTAGFSRKVQKGPISVFGDAAGMIQPLTGEGLKYIEHSSHIWADCLLNGKNLNYHWVKSKPFVKLVIGDILLRTFRIMEHWNIPAYSALPAVGCKFYAK